MIIGLVINRPSTPPQQSSHVPEIGQLLEEEGNPSLSVPPRPLLPPLAGRADVTVNLNSSVGTMLLLEETCLNAHYFGGLANHFSTQISQAMCGVATATMMLNALALPQHRIPGLLLCLVYSLSDIYTHISIANIF